MNKFQFGKYKGKNICDVATYDFGYIVWALASVDRFRLSEQEMKEVCKIYIDSKPKYEADECCYDPYWD